MDFDFIILVVAVASMLIGGGIFVGGLMLGWRMGRESIQKPMFDYSKAQEPEKQPAVVADEDPWMQYANRGEEMM